MHRTRLTVVTCLAAALCLSATASGQKDKDKNAKPDPKRPKLTLKALPTLGIAPLRVVFTAELEGGSNDFEEYYCPTTVWEWGDGGVSEQGADCPPYEAGKSQIKRRFTVEHIYKKSTNGLRVYFSLRHHDREVAAAGINITVQPGGTDNSQ